MRVNLTYFKETGKYYSEGHYNTSTADLFSIWDEVRRMRIFKTLPGLIIGHSNFIVLVDVPWHPHRHPKLIL